MKSPPRVVLYGKAGCHLCDEARAALERLRARRELDLREVDVSLDPVLNRRYGERVPVVEVDGEEALELHVDEAALDKALDRVGA
jgi:glutaredoxin